MSEIKEKISQALEIYSKKVVLRAVINVIPWVGGSLDVVLSSGGQRIIEERIKRLFEQFSADMGKIKEDAIDKSFIETEYFFDLLRKVMESSTKTREQQKIELYSKILCNSLLKDVVGKEMVEDYLSVLTELSVREVCLAKTIYEMQKGGLLDKEHELQMALRTGWNTLSDKLSIPSGELDFFLKRLERTGLIKEITGAYFDYEGGVYVITQTFKVMMQFLNEGN